MTLLTKADKGKLRYRWLPHKHEWLDLPEKYYWMHISWLGALLGGYKYQHKIQPQVCKLCKRERELIVARRNPDLDTEWEELK